MRLPLCTTFLHLSSRRATVMQQPSFLRHLAIFAILAIGPALPSVSVAQVSSLNAALAQKQALSDSDKAEIEAFVKANSSALSGTDAIALKNARNALLKPLEAKGTTAGFRIAYGAAILNVIDGIIKTGDELQAANALRIAGELATSSAASATKLGLASAKPGVRYAATFGYARSFDAVERAFRAGGQLREVFFEVIEIPGVARQKQVEHRHFALLLHLGRGRRQARIVQGDPADPRHWFSRSSRTCTESPCACRLSDVASRTAEGPMARRAAGVIFVNVVRFRKSITDNPLENRAERAVGSTWFGPPM